MNLLMRIIVNSFACAGREVSGGRVFPCGKNAIIGYIDARSLLAKMQPQSAAVGQKVRQIARRSDTTISFDAIAPGLLVRTTDDGHLIALDFISTLTNGDRKKASQTLARVAMRDDTSALLTLRRVACKPKPRKLLSFSNAVQLLLVLPKRTVCMETRRAVAGILTDHFEYRHQQAAQEEMAFPRGEQGLSVRQAHVDLTRREVELDIQRMRLPLERLNQCMELMERCGPMSEEERLKFRALIAEQATGADLRPFFSSLVQ